MQFKSWLLAGVTLCAAAQADAALVKVDFQGIVSDVQNAAALPVAVAVGNSVSGFYFYEDSLVADSISADVAYYYGNANQIGMQFSISGLGFASNQGNAIPGLDQFIQVSNDSPTPSGNVDEFRLYSFAQPGFSNGASLDALSINYSGNTSVFSSIALPLSAVLGTGRAEGLDAAFNPYSIQFDIQSATVSSVPLPPALGLFGAGLMMLARRLRKSA